MQVAAFIGGNFVGSTTSTWIPVRNPADDSEIAHVADCGPADAHAAVDAAAAAFPAWRALPAVDRARPLRRLAELMARDAERLADL